MTTTQSITVSLDWSKKLKEAGFPQDGCVNYLVCYSDGTFHKFWSESERKKKWVGSWQKQYPCYAAPTAEEILRRLPASMLHRNRRDMYRMMIRLTPRRHWSIGYATSKADWVFKEGIAAIQEAGTLANAAAAMYCYLADNHLLPSSK